MGISAPISGFKPGDIKESHSATLETGWLWCDGSAVSRTSYAALFASIGVINGTGDGSTTFNLPDLRGRSTIGKDNMGGTAANRVTTGGGGLDGVTLGAVGGGETVTLATADIPSHQHNASLIGATVGGGASTVGVSGTGSSVGAGGQLITAQGGGGSHSNIPPAAIVNKIIKF
jgi:microcystin-dependent protein